mgnify:CR=1 FL=1
MNYRDTNQSVEDFAQMAENYNTTKPVVSKNHTREDNIRPVGRRSRKHEHMIKVSAYKYMIYDGYCAGDPKFSAWGDKVPPTEKETLALAPIVWTLSPKGDIETIRIRNGSGNYAHCSRYTFLENTLPLGLRFIVHNGKQYISNGTQYLLPKSRYNPFYPPNAYNTLQNGFPMSVKDDKKYLTFARKVGSDRYDWKVIGDTWTIQHERKRVDTKYKAKIKPHADVFYKWLDVMHSFIMPDFSNSPNQWRERREYVEKAVEELNGFLSTGDATSRHQYTGYGWTHPRHIERPKEQHGKLLKIMSTDQHPMRMQLGVDFLRNVDFANITSGSEVRAKYNSYVNKVFGLVGTLSDEKIVKERK